MLAAGRAVGGGLCEERPGAALCQTQLALMEPLEDMAEPIIHVCSASVLNVCKKVRNSPENTKVGEGGEEMLQEPEQRFPCSLWREPHWSRRLQPMEDSTLE